MKTTLKIWCQPCSKAITPKKVLGKEIYPHRPDLARHVFFQCPACRNYVGSHGPAARFEKRGKPLGDIVSAEVRVARYNLHEYMDPLWRKSPLRRANLYRMVAQRLDKKAFHAAELRTVEEVSEARRAVAAVAASLGLEHLLGRQ